MGTQRITRSQMKRGARSQREQLESYSLLRKVIDRAAGHGHKLGEVLAGTGPRGGKTYQVRCSCGFLVEGRRNAWSAYNDGMGHLGEILGEKDREKVGRALTITRRSA